MNRMFSAEIENLLGELGEVSGNHELNLSLLYDIPPLHLVNNPSKNIEVQQGLSALELHLQLWCRRPEKEIDCSHRGFAGHVIATAILSDPRHLTVGAGV